MNDFFAVEEVLQHRREQADSVKGKETPFRVQFRYSGSTRSYQYFTDTDSAGHATDRRASYGPTGRAHIDHPLSQQIQARGPRGGWSKYQERTLSGVSREGER